MDGAHVVPPSAELRTAYCRIGEPPSLGAAHDTSVDVEVAFAPTAAVIRPGAVGDV